MGSFLCRNLGFMGCQEDYQSADFVLFGIPMDYTVSFQPGSRFGPQAIRSVSEGIEEYSFYQHRSLADVRFVDSGDVDLPLGNVKTSLDRIEEVARGIHADGKIPVAMGGEHLVTLPLVRAAAAKYPDLSVLHLDAHADLREEYLGEQLSHATVMRRVADLIGPGRLYQFGIRSGTREEYVFASQNTNFFPGELLQPLKQVVAQWDNSPVYISLDIDMVDPAFAPGTGTPEPGGCTSKELLEAVQMLKQLPVVGFDLVEVLPTHDHSNRTALLAAKIIRELLVGLLPLGQR